MTCLIVATIYCSCNSVAKAADLSRFFVKLKSSYNHCDGMSYQIAQRAVNNHASYYQLTLYPGAWIFNEFTRILCFVSTRNVFLVEQQVGVILNTDCCTNQFLYVRRRQSV